MFICLLSTFKLTAHKKVTLKNDPPESDAKNDPPDQSTHVTTIIGELEYWRTKDKAKRRSDLVKAKDEVAHGGQVIADLLTIGQVMSTRRWKRTAFPSHRPCFA